MHRAFLRAAAAALLLVPSALAQTIKEIVPAAFAPGDVVSVRGDTLAGLVQIPFTATVGGFVGTWTINAPVLTATPTELIVQAPLFNNFVPPFAGSSPFGTVAAAVPGYFMEGTFGQTTTAGQGSPSSAVPLDRLVIDFDLAAGGPQPGNANFTLELENAPSGAAAFVLAGRPLAAPVPFAGGQLVVDTHVPFLILGPHAVGVNHQAQAKLPIPAMVGATVALQWFSRDPVSNKPLISNALVLQL